MKNKKRAAYIDGFVFVVPKKKVNEYKKMAKSAGKIWIKYGALAYKECMGDDLKPDIQGFKYLPFPKMTKLKPSETAWFSYIEYKSETHRNLVNKKVTKEMEQYQKNTPEHMKNMPFDMKRMAFGGFKIVVDV